MKPDEFEKLIAASEADDPEAWGHIAATMELRDVMQTRATELLALWLAASAQQELQDEIRNTHSSRIPHPDYWHQSIYEKREAVRKALADLEAAK